MKDKTRNRIARFTKFVFDNSEKLSDVALTIAIAVFVICTSMLLIGTTVWFIMKMFS